MTPGTVARQAALSMGILQVRILEMPSSRGSSQPRDQTQVSGIAGGFFAILATREAQEYCNGWSIPSPADLHNPGIELGSPALQADSLPAELPWKPKKTGMGNFSLLQEIFPTQESNWGLLPCRWILYQLNYQGSFNHAKFVQITSKM